MCKILRILCGKCELTEFGHFPYNCINPAMKTTKHMEDLKVSIHV